MKKNSGIILVIILVIAIILRFYLLGSVPISPDWDEAALGYNAYSILHTGKDEYGVFLPVVLRSFGDYKPALYAYLAIPGIALSGLNIFAVRLPSAVMGVVGVVAMYFLVKELFEERETKRNSMRNYAECLALLCAFLFAVSPWELQLSRVAFETSVGLTFNILTGLFFLKGLKKPWMLSLAAFFAGLNLSVYDSEKIFTPLLVLAFIIIYRKALFAVSKKYLAFGVIIGLIVCMPMLLYFFTNPGSLGRAQETTLFSQQTQLLRYSITNLAQDTKHHDLIGMLFDNRRVIYAKEILGGYLSHFDSNWLFIEGDNARHHAPGMGLMYLLDLPFLLIGIYLFIFGEFKRQTKYVVFSWLLLGPVPASITYEVPHAVRTMNMLPMLLIFVAVGYIGAFEFFKKYKGKSIMYKGIRYGVYLLFFLFAIFNFGYYLNQYFVQQNYFNAQDWQYGYAQAVGQIASMQNRYKKIIVSNVTPLDESYIFFLFYLKYPPSQYQELSAQGQNSGSNKHFENFYFQPFNWNIQKHEQDALYVGTPSDFPQHVTAKETIYNPDGTPAILIVDPKDNL
jgi:4-amino-4-deoxy-L-arabinose transferase-like glycosyltransferase